MCVNVIALNTSPEPSENAVISALFTSNPRVAGMGTEGGEPPLPLLSMDENRRDSGQPNPNTPISLNRLPRRPSGLGVVPLSLGVALGWPWGGFGVPLGGFVQPSF
jgi:hypothetical protein